MKTLADYGIHLEPGATRTLCPQCSPGRAKKYDKCLAVDAEKGVWFCHHCGWSGGLRSGGREAPPHFALAPLTDEKVVAWFAGRGITRPTLAAFRITSGPSWMQGPNGGGLTETIRFPYFYEGAVVNVKYRTADKRFRQEKNARKCLYNYDMALRAADESLLVVEGEIDCLALYEAGFRAVVSVPDGAPTPNARTYASKFDFLHGAEPLFAKYKRVVLAVDDDAPGRTLRAELCRRIGTEKCLRVLWPEGCKDADDVLVRRGPEALRRCIREAAFFPVDGVQTVQDLWDAVFALHEQPERPGADIGWGCSAFNVEPGQMTVVTGIPSHGKSTFIDALRVNLFRSHGWPSAAFSPENWPAQGHLASLAAMYAQRRFNDLTRDELYAALAETARAFFFIQPDKDDEMMSLAAVLERAKTLVYREGIKVLVIDPWNELAHAPGEREDQYISAQLAVVRRFARVNDLHVFIVAHPRQPEKDKNGSYPPPTAYDIAGGAMWRNKADNILCVYRPDMKSGETHVLVQKIRFRRNGRAGEKLRLLFRDPVYLAWNGDC